MRQEARVRPTIGFLSTWSVYEGTAIDSYSHTLLQGICAAAHEQDCNLLLGCGISLPASPRASRTVWAVPGAGVDFVPVGPWNTDGLIVIPDDLSDSQSEYVQDLIRSGYPVVLTTAEKPGPLVAVDNAGGIRQAFNHLWQHGHRRIALIAGKSGRGGDSAERLSAYREALREAGIEEDARLIAFGEHRREDGRIAMQQILSTGAPFTAVLASNDLSCLGAMEVLREAGRRIPDDVAVIGFDDILDARSHLPPLTTVRHPTFTLGYQTVLSLLDEIAGKRIGETHTRVPTQLVIRQSCGCRPESTPVTTLVPAAPSDLETAQTTLARAMAEATLVEARHSTRQEIEALCLNLARTFTSSLGGNDPGLFDAAMQQLFDWLEVHGEDAYAWHAALSILRRGLSNLLPLIPGANLVFADTMIDRARLEIAEQAQRQTTDALLQHKEMANRLGLMTSQLLAAFDASESANILAHHLPQLGIRHALVALYSPREDDPLSQCTVLLDAGLPESGVGRQFPVRDFPPPELYPSDLAFQLAILPLVIDDHTTGFVAFGATNLEPCAAIVHNLASALRTSRLYRDALEGRRLAEEANRLKSRFLSTVSHELRTPLNLITGLSAVLLQEGEQVGSARCMVNREDVEHILTSAQHLDGLIRDVLDLARSEAGQLKLVCEPLHLAETLQPVLAIGQQSARDKGLSWRAEIPKELPRVWGDRTRLRQVMLNLVHNAVKFTARGEVAVIMTVEDDRVIVSVQDTGLGIPLEEQEAIFDEFRQSERTAARGYGGLGLGLAICKRLVELHGGEIGVRSSGEKGGGSTFYFTLPAMARQPALLDAEVPLAEMHQVLLLVKDIQGGGLLRDYLVRQGLEVTVHPVGEEEEGDWLMWLLAGAPEAVVLDREVASERGWKILKVLKGNLATQHVPVLFYAFAGDSGRGSMLEIDYLTKPMGTAELAEALACKGLLDGEEDGEAEKKVLVVDDEPGVLKMHARIVESQSPHYRVLRARDGREALEVIREEHPDLVLLDLMMPELDGFGVLEAMREEEMSRNIPVIVLTGQVLTEEDMARLNRGVASVLGKGLFSVEETLGHIEATLAHRCKLSVETQRVVRRAMAYVHTHYAEQVSLKDIAAYVGLSEQHLIRSFRKESGITPIDYLKRYRIRQARALLEAGDKSITEVALEVGFSDSSYFARVFRREVGVSPGAYRGGER